jgi:hypothetical protein
MQNLWIFHPRVLFYYDPRFSRVHTWILNVGKKVHVSIKCGLSDALTKSVAGPSLRSLSGGGKIVTLDQWKW